MLLIAGGSPPRMRGKELHVGILLCGIGITPAYAGKRSSTFRRCRRTRDHPRVCGEKKCPKAWCIGQQGSPPHMRGKGVAAERSTPDNRITPAYAGKSDDEAMLRCAVRDHPRICGEKAETDAACALCWGSPPHMRGKVFLCALCVDFAGITPAYAGKRKKEFDNGKS